MKDTNLDNKAHHLAMSIRRLQISGGTEVAQITIRDQPNGFCSSMFIYRENVAELVKWLADWRDEGEFHNV